MISAIVTDRAALQSLRDEWRDLSASVSANTGFFATWDYTCEYIDFHQPSNWFVVTVRNPAGRLEGVFPLRTFPLRSGGREFRACQPVGPDYLPYIEFPIRSESRRETIIALLNDALSKQVRVHMALFWPLHESSPLYLALVEDLGNTPRLKTLRFTNNVNEIETRGIDFDTYAATLPSSTLGDARYCERRMRREGTLEFRLHDDRDLANEMAQLCRQNLDKFGDKHLHGKRKDWSQWMPRIVESMGARGMANFSTLRFNDKVISSSVTFVYSGRRTLYQWAYDAEFARYSPSKVLLANLIAHSFREREVFCFGAGRHEYKAGWVRSSGELKSAFVFLHDEAHAAFAAHLDKKSLQFLGVA